MYATTELGLTPRTKRLLEKREPSFVPYISEHELAQRIAFIEEMRSMPI